MTHTPYTNDGSQAAPRLACFLNLGNLDQLPATSTAPQAQGRDLLLAIRDAGFEGVQGGSAADCQALGVPFTTDGRINTAEDADPIAEQAAAEGAICATLHVGWGIEDDADVDAMIDGVLEASEKYAVPMYVETHRATVTQDIWRSVQLARRRPGLRFNADYSHWYTGLEMPYGGLETKLDYAADVIERAGFMHGRIGNSGSIQVGVGDTLEEAFKRDYVQHFVEMWKRTFAGFLQAAGPGDYFVFAPELLHAGINYARVFPNDSGNLIEETDRWQQAILYCDIARHAFALAQAELVGV